MFVAIQGTFYDPHIESNIFRLPIPEIYDFVFAKKLIILQKHDRSQILSGNTPARDLTLLSRNTLRSLYTALRVITDPRASHAPCVLRSTNRV